MSDTPRNDELNRQTAGYSVARHLILVDELSRQLECELDAANERKGQVAVALAAMTLERDALRRELDELMEWLAKAAKAGKDVTNV